jgi:hypothetical protein
METKRILKIMSNTHYGRGEPLPTEEIRRNIETALLAFNEIVPNIDFSGYFDEDYGWYCVLTPEMEADILSRFPESLVEEDVTYVHNYGGFKDMFSVSEGRMVIVYICDEDMKGQPTSPVERTLEAMFIDWFDSYGRY